MSNKHINLDQLNHSNAMSNKALECVMRDVIDGMEEIANMAAFSQDASACFEIIAITPAEQTDLSTGAATGLHLDEQTSADIIPIRKGRKRAAA